MISQKQTHNLILLFVILCALFFITHILIISQSLSDGTHINPDVNSSQWQADGVIVTVLDDTQNELRDGDVLLAIEGEPLSAWVDRIYCGFEFCDTPTPPELREGTTLTYTVLRNNKEQTVQATIRPYPFWEAIRRSWGGLAFPIVCYIIFLALFLKRPNEPSVYALILAAAGLLGSMGWAFGQDTVGILNGTSFWLYRFATETIYWLSVIGVLHFMLVFPKPLPFIAKRRWILFMIYPLCFLLYGFLLFVSMQLTTNKLLWMASIFSAQSVVVTLFYGTAFLALFSNYRTLTQDKERQQIRIVVFTTGLLLLLSVVIRALPTMLFGESLVTSNEIAILALIIPVAIVFAVLRNNLWGIDFIINRTLLFTSVSATIVGLYIILVAIIGRLLQTETNLPTSIIATGIVAVMFQPIRFRLQHLVNLAMYGKRDDPAAVLTELAQQLEKSNTSASILPNLVQTIAQTLKIPHVAIWQSVSADQFEPIVIWGQTPDHVEKIPLTYQNKSIGTLIIAPRSPEEPFTRDEMQLLNTIGALTANTVQAVQLSDELRRSRQRIVTAREEERRRLRRDLHDGLGPQLASQTLSLEAIDQLMSTNPEKAHELVTELKQQAQEAILDVRRLIYDLRPPALDNLGLLGALKQSAAHYETGNLRFRFHTDDALPDLPAAVETAVYRITQEAMTNVVRHANATICTVTIVCTNNQLMLQVQDNGQGLSPNQRSGVGLQSMVERAAELNGNCVLKSLPHGGTLVEAQLPLEVFGE